MTNSEAFDRRTWFRFVGGAFGASLIGCQPEAKRSNVRISAAGATFPYPLYERWLTEYARKTGVVVSYSPSGSSDGILAITTDRTDLPAPMPR